MPFLEANPINPRSITRRLRRALDQNRLARSTVGSPEGTAPSESSTHPRPDRDAELPLTTLDATIRPIGHGRYRRLGWAPGEPHIRRVELAPGAPAASPTDRRSLLYFAHHTDIHITDAQSPSRLVGAKSLGWIHPGMDAAHRPQETMTTQVFDQLIRATNRVSSSPISGAPMAFCLQTGDHTDNRTAAELDWWLDLLAGRSVTPNTGAEGRYEGVQRSGWQAVWNPDVAGNDRPQRHGYPHLPGVLDAAVSTFSAEGLAVPWVTVFGNHDRIFSGTFGPARGVRIDLVEQLVRAGAHSPSNSVALIESIIKASVRGSKSFNRHVGSRRRGWKSVTADAEARRPVGPAEYLQHILDAHDGRVPDRQAQLSPGHGFGIGDSHADTDTGANTDTWWSLGHGPHVQIIGLDTSHHTTGDTGRIGPRQAAWLEAELQRHHSRFYDRAGREVTGDGTDRLVIIASHHNSRVLDNTHDDAYDPGDATGGEALIDLLGRFPNVILWINGHSHQHWVTPHRSRSEHGFWEVSTASVIDFAQQGRLFEVLDNGDGTISVVATVLDHAAPPATPHARRADAWTAEGLASLSRELAANDDRWLDPMALLGDVDDRNVELVVSAPFSLR